ncbi:hypothetical protein I553_3046 [Mycobacterium xenopi 4042]|uniref:Uncharacterized protein n=1 Tax=Mycobacterium xenopi 4042 TaxID=1299334 RepID=X8BJN6_MYCXE|nr:hypothetical protein I553_3046 [Mycobacterium xenopi 4042]
MADTVSAYNSPTHRPVPAQRAVEHKQRAPAPATDRRRAEPAASGALIATHMVVSVGRTH